MAVLSFAAMYFLMFAMVDQLDNVILNVNQVYMAALMAAPMVLIELALMTTMYMDRKRNAVIAVAALVIGVSAYAAIRAQAGIADREFARSMIPHHASAILMCNEASISSAEIRELCHGPNGIIASQRREIEQLKAFLR
jgi:uncharacterized protein (DUF305 family)